MSLAKAFLETFHDWLFADVNQEFNDVVPAAGPGGFTDNCTIATVGRRGTRGLQLGGTSSNVQTATSKAFRKILADAPTLPRFSFGFPYTYVNSLSNAAVSTTFTAASCIIAFMQGTGVQVWLRQNNDGTVSVYGGTTLLGTTTAAVSQNTTIHIGGEILIHASAGEVRLYFDDILVLTVTGVVTRAQATTAWSGFQLGPAGRNSSNVTFTVNYNGDFYMEYDAGETTLNGTITSGATSLVVADGSIFPVDGPFRLRIGDELMRVGARSGNTLSSITRNVAGTAAVSHTNGVAVYAGCMAGDLCLDVYVPNANGAKRDGTPSTGSDDYAVVDEAQANGDTDYLTLATVGNETTFGIPSDVRAGADVFAVQVQGQFRKEDAGTAGLQLGLRIGGVQYYGTAQGLSTAYSRRKTAFRASPVDSKAFTTITGTQLAVTKSA